MTRLISIPSIGVLACAAILAVLSSSSITAQAVVNPQPDSYASNNLPPDARFKADILLVVAHPDDEILASAYLEREILDNHKRVAVVYATRGDGGNNMVGPEQAAAMGQIREMEGRQAESALGITNVWWLTGLDTPTQNVLNSLERWGHGACLDQLVRIIRLTRPAVILTFLPDFTTGENHGDHQAAGVLATEAFDLAGDSTAFSEQVSPVTNPDKTMNLTEGLRPWQPEKIYYFYNPTHDIFARQGPQYSSQDISPSRNVSYGMLAAQSFALHRTQGGDETQRAIDRHTLETSHTEGAELAREDDRFIFGKSLVPSGAMNDVFAGVVPEGVPFQRAPGFAPIQYAKPALLIGDPWNFYHEFWRAHRLDHLAHLVPLEITVKAGGDPLTIPLIVVNPLDKAINVTLAVEAPAGWDVKPLLPFPVEPHARYFLRVRAAPPATSLPGWQQFRVSAESDGQSLGTISIRAELSTGWVAPQ